MLASAGIVMISLIIALLEVPGLLKKNFRKELMAFLFLLLLGTGLGIAKALQVKIPNPLDWVAFIFSPFSEMLKSS